MGGHKANASKGLAQDFGMVLQDTWLFSGTIRDNIAMAKRMQPKKR